MQQKTLITLTILVILVAALVLLGSATHLFSPSGSTSTTGQPVRGPIGTPTPSPIPLPTSTTKTESVQGTVTAVSGTNISVKTAAATQEYSLVGTKDVQRFTQGSLEGGNVKTAKATLADVKVGQEVMLVINATTKAVISLFILK